MRMTFKVLPKTFFHQSLGLAAISLLPWQSLAVTPILPTRCELVFAKTTGITAIPNEVWNDLGKMFLEIQESQDPHLKKLFSEWLDNHSTDAHTKSQLLQRIEKTATELKQAHPEPVTQATAKTLQSQRRAILGALPRLQTWKDLKLSPELITQHQENQMLTTVFENGLGQFHQIDLQWGVDAVAVRRDDKNVSVFSLLNPKSVEFNLRPGILSSVAPVYAEVQKSQTHTQITNLTTGRVSAPLSGVPFELFPELINSRSVILRTGSQESPTATWYSQTGQPRHLGANFGFAAETGRVAHFDETGALRIFDIQTGMDFDLAKVFPQATREKFQAVSTHFVLQDIFLLQNSRNQMFALDLLTWQLHPIMSIPSDAKVFAMGPGRYLMQEAQDSFLPVNTSHQFLAADPVTQNFFPITSMRLPEFSKHSDWVTSIFADSMVIADNFRTGEHLEVPRQINSQSYYQTGNKVVSTERLDMFVFDLAEKTSSKEVNLGVARLLPGTDVWLQGFTNFLATAGAQSMMNQMLRNQGLKPRFSGSATSIPYGHWGLRLKQGDQWREMTISEESAPPQFSPDLRYLMTTEGKTLVIKKVDWE